METGADPVNSSINSYVADEEISETCKRATVCGALKVALQFETQIEGLKKESLKACSFKISNELLHIL